MIEININKITKSFGFNNVLDKISFDIKSGEKISLVGNNGCGKSTLLKIIAGDESYDSGTIAIRNNSKIGYLKQDIEINENVLVKDILYKNINDILEIEEKLHEYELKMQSASENELETILKKYGNLQDKYINLGGYEISEKIGRIVTGFKIEELLDKNISHLSGGEKRIVSLASIMINEPNILLLDEPTNHLDIDTLEWFENYLINYKGTVLIVSHDRYFLDRVTSKTIQIKNGKEDIYHTNYSGFLIEKEARELLEHEAYKIQQKKIKHLENSAKQLKSWAKISGNERFTRRAKSIEKRIEKIDKLKRPENKKEIPLNINSTKRSGNEVLVFRDFNLSIGNKDLLKNVNLEINYKDRVCLMGKNGSGKSTLIKKIIENNDSNLLLGSNINIGYIPQNIIFKDEFKTVYETAREYFIGEEYQLRSALFKFLFTGENIFKRVDKLSGGERVRLKLFELMHKNTNFLILDEPTNHIDIETKEVLESTLNNYEGTILFISHDRYFINKLTNKIVFIDNCSLREFIGNYNDFKNKYNIV